MVKDLNYVFDPDEPTRERVRKMMRDDLYLLEMAEVLGISYQSVSKHTFKLPDFLRDDWLCRTHERRVRESRRTNRAQRPFLIKRIARIAATLALEEQYDALARARAVTYYSRKPETSFTPAQLMAAFTLFEEGSKLCDIADAIDVSSPVANRILGTLELSVSERDFKA